MTGRTRTISRTAAAAIGGAVVVCLLSIPASAIPAGSRGGSAPRIAGPSAPTRSDTETVQDFAARIITCAADRWPVPGGAEKAICIAQRESGLVPTASSPSGEYLGLFQHSAAAWPDRYTEWTRPGWALKQSALNGRTNAVVTMRMVNAEGWGPWSGTGC
jgi:hypothetical protein